MLEVVLSGYLNIAMENGPFIDGLPIKNGDFPWLTFTDGLPIKNGWIFPWQTVNVITRWYQPREKQPIKTPQSALPLVDATPCRPNASTVTMVQTGGVYYGRRD